MRVAVLQVPYDSGRRGERVGAGPLALVEHGLVADLAAAGHDVELVAVELDGGFVTEVGAAIELQRRTAAAVARAAAGGRLPVLLTGNCNTAVLGALGGLAPRRLAVAWLDAHGDFNTPETSTSGFFDGMALALATGRCWRSVAAGLAGFRPLADAHVALIAARDLDPLEAEALAGSGITRLGAGDLAAWPAVLERWAADPGGLYLHVDLDALDPRELVANPWTVPGGLTRAELVALIAAARRRLPPAAVAFTAFAPDHDDPAKAVAIVLAALAALAG